MRPWSDKRTFGEQLGPLPEKASRWQLDDESAVAVIGGGPAGSFFSFFLLKTAANVGINIDVDIYEPRDFGCPGPKGCNHCGGIVSESLVQLMATEGINLPPKIVRRGIDSYLLHMDVGSVRIETPLREKRIAAVYRGGGPRGSEGLEAGSFDHYLQDLCVGQGANLIQERVTDLEWVDERPFIHTRSGRPKQYDLVVAAVGVNKGTAKIFQKTDFGYCPPDTAKTYICEFRVGQEILQRHIGTSMQVFLLNIPRLEFAAFIPKGDYLTLCLLGDDIDRDLVTSFLQAPEVVRCLPPGVELKLPNCQCAPKINVRAAAQPFRDRLVLIGDCGVTRLYKDGIGAAYRTAKAAATTAVFHGVSAQDFERHYWKACQTIERDNAIGKGIFMATGLAQKWCFARRAILRMVSEEQTKEKARRPMSMVVWDLFTGSAPYREIFRRTLSPVFMARLAWNMLAGFLPVGRRT